MKLSEWKKYQVIREMSNLRDPLQSFSMRELAMTIPTPIGEMYATSDFSAITGTGWGPKPHSHICGSNEILEWLRNWFDGYFVGEIIEIPPIKKCGLSAFASDVITALSEQVPYGTTISYNELGVISGYQNSSRAVGSVMSKNPWPILVPCHRVIASNGDVGNYSGNGGQMTKLRLIKMEKNHSGRIFR